MKSAGAESSRKGCVCVSIFSSVFSNSKMLIMPLSEQLGTASSRAAYK